MRPAPFPLVLRSAALLAGFLLVACSSDSGGLSNPNPYAARTACKSDAQCSGATVVCDIPAGYCVQCLFDTQCSNGARCRSETCVVPTPCASSLDCVKDTLSPICEPGAGECVGCVSADDCDGTADCVKNECIAYQACKTSLTCNKGQVCDTLSERCVECLTANDCAEGEVCAAAGCMKRTSCVSDLQCTPDGKLCDKALGYCVSCLTNDACPASYHCAVGECALDACEAGASKCEGNSVVACDSSGQGWMTPQPCLQGASCKASGGVATCGATLCNAGQTYCQGEKLLTCAADGMSVTSTIDCAAQGKHCNAGTCTTQVCTPNSFFCDGKELRECDATGASSVVVQTCSGEEVCDPSLLSCVALFCSPGSAVCNGAVATTCNGAGTGYSGGGTDCSLQGKDCSAGACMGCSSGGGAPTQVRLTEVFMGSTDYLVVSNLGSCPAQLDTLALRISSNKPSQMDFDFPPVELAAGASAYVIVSASKEGDIAAQGIAAFLLPTLGEWVSLCDGPCLNGVILDYFAHADGGQPPSPPPGITFTPGPMVGINDASAATYAYKRVGYAGGYPAFSAGDWQVAAASRP